LDQSIKVGEDMIIVAVIVEEVRKKLGRTSARYKSDKVERKIDRTAERLSLPESIVRALERRNEAKFRKK
jgi:hypothetical protein